MMWHERRWEIIDREPLHIAMLGGFDVRRHTDPAGYNSKIIHLDPLDTAVLYEYIMLDSGWIDCDTHFFLRLTDRTLTEELSLLHLASWECPESWPCIEFDTTTDEEYMGTMETDRVGSGCDELGHREGNK
jgi:hypothetical protein